MKRTVIIGAGIIGTSVARELAKRRTGKITVLEKETEVGRHASGRNSGVIHSGINQKPGTLKARMCVEGSRCLREYCRKKSVPMRECGTLVAARNEKEIETLQKLLAMGKECGVSGLALLTPHELKEREPAAQGVAALFSPTGATVDSLALLQSLVEETKGLGVDFRFGQKVAAIEKCLVVTGREKIEADYVINCAGLYADKIAHQMGVGLQYRVVPFRGEYLEVKNCEVRSMIYQAPDLRFPFLSIHLTRETDGRVLAGPSAVLAFGREAYDKEWDFKEMGELFSSRQFWGLVRNPEFLGMAVENTQTSISKNAFLKQIQSLVPTIRKEQLFPARSGIRAQLVDSEGKMVNDLLVEKGENSTHVLNVVSPGMTSSLAFAEFIAAQIPS